MNDQLYSLRILFTILSLLVVVITASAQTHNVTRRSGVTTSKPNTSTTTKKTGASTKKAGTSSTTPRKPSSGTPQRKQQSVTSSSAQSKLNPIIQDLINNMVYLEGGTFTMGATTEQGSDAYDWEKPAHQVMLSSFYICRHEVTQEEWDAVMNSNPSSFKGAKRPVENVNWDDCQDFIRKLNEMTGGSFRLPTEAEWEYAARGGNKSKGYKYSGGNNLGSLAWFHDNSGNTTHPVAQKSSNELGIYDMMGNVWEWCSDRYGLYDSSAQTNPQGSTSDSNQVIRGGSWDDSARDCRASSRSGFMPGIRRNDLGFRLVLSYSF